MTDITIYIEVAIKVIALLISSLLVPYIVKKFSAEQLKNLKDWAGIAVRAFEQSLIGRGRGAEKKQEVLYFLEEKGFKINSKDVELAIEAAVFELKNPVPKE